ncbi:late competence protein ComER [Shouchella clausii]|nr:late competence protein ComER [Shouchella clausii]MCY1103388.1 late competence protein ComER [Shouchella clausii]MEB5472800.1 late competence protein ComER [Shouchella clausii]MEB5480028.1 late competence protein ComER [Shouchella clausii]MED4158642.1 late competence protein ComER [Shouchella clausii]MED4177093.1 late competence protein ComER [Shouchella clausii]
MEECENMRVGFIGTGSMGSLLIESFIDAGALKQSNISIINRSPEKAAALKATYPGITMSVSLEEIASTCEWLFLCVKPKEMPALFHALQPHVAADQIAISITSPISVESLDAALPCKTCRIIPSILNRTLSGSTLVTFGNKCTQEDQANLLRFVSAVSEPLQIEEEITRVASDIVSCGPAFFSFLAQRFIDGAVSETSISQEEATELTTSMIIGLGKLLESGHYTLPALQKRVCVPGGITGEGLAVLDDELGDGFCSLFKRTHEKYATEKEKLLAEVLYEPK